MIEQAFFVGLCEVGSAARRRSDRTRSSQTACAGQPCWFTVCWRGSRRYVLLRVVAWSCEVQVQKFQCVSW